MKEYPKELEKDLVKALGKLIGYNCINMKPAPFNYFLVDLETFCEKHELTEILDKAMDISLSSMVEALKSLGGILNDSLR